MRVLILGIIFVSSNAFAFLQQSCKDVRPDIDSFAGVEILFKFVEASSQGQNLEIKVFREGVLSEDESETFVNLKLFDNFPSAGQIKITSPDERVRIFADHVTHPITGELQLPLTGYIRWVSPLTVGIESVVNVVCPLN